MTATRRGDQAAADVDPDDAGLVGRLLRERRQSRGLSLEQVGLTIRVGAHHVRAVEEGRLADLPPQPYGRGLIRAYATLLGLEPEELLRLCGPALTGDASGGRTTIFRYPDRVQFIWREWAVPFAFAAVVAAIVIARALLEPAPIAFDAPVTAPVARPLQRAPALADIPISSDQSAAAEIEIPGVRVLLQCEGSTWAEATPDGGEKRRYELGPGQSFEVTARARLVLSLGDAGVIRLRVNQRELGFIGFKGETKSGLLFTASAPTPIVPPAAVVGD